MRASRAVSPLAGRCAIAAALAFAPTAASGQSQTNYGAHSQVITAEMITELPGPVPLGLNRLAMVPSNNPLDPEVVALGRKPFFDRNLSRDRTVACASCHQPGLAFADTARFSAGIHGQVAARNTPSIANRVYGGVYFYDGRATTLEQAVLMPVQDSREMAMTVPEVLARVDADDGYDDLFMAAFMNGGVTQTQIAQALASYVRTLRAGNSAADRFESGERGALSASAARGRELFFGPANCASCHSGPNFSNEAFQSLTRSADPGRAAVTGNPADQGKFKVPSLRDVARTAPYMHDGRFSTLDQVVEFYNLGGDVASPGADPLRVINLSVPQKADLIAYLRALTSETRTD